MKRLPSSSIGRVAVRILRTPHPILKPAQPYPQPYLQRLHHGKNRIPPALSCHGIVQRQSHLSSSLPSNLPDNIRPRPFPVAACLSSHELRWSTGSLGLAFALLVGVVLVGGVFSNDDPPGLEYPPLDGTKDSLRVLTLHPGGWRDTIKCDLTAIAFSEIPECEALSYTWGDSARTKTILVNGSRVDVKENLWQALKHFRHPARARVLWIDSLCINQADTAEKNKQIPLMAFIYRRAQQVLIWLGNHEPPPRVQDSLQRGRDWSDDSTRGKKSKAWKQMEPFIWQLAHEEYWKRTWIIQETIMASKLLVCYGKESLDWQDFVTWIDRYQRLNPKDPVLSPIFALEAMRQSKYTNAMRFSLKHLIEIFRDSFSSIPSDKIYAFLGMSYDHLDNSIAVDYGKSLHDVYRDVIRFFRTASASEAREGSIELVYYSALVRRLLTRKAIQQPKSKRAVMDDFMEDEDEDKIVLPAIVPNRVQEKSTTSPSTNDSPRMDTWDREYRMFSSYSLNYSPVWVTETKRPRPRYADTERSAGTEQKLTHSEEDEQREQEEKKKKRDYRTALLIGTAIVLGLGAGYYYFTRQRPDRPKEWQWQASGPEDLGTWIPIEDNAILENDQVTLRGLIAGRVTYVGPSMHNVVSSHEETKHWTASLSSHFPVFSNLNQARGLNEKLLQLLINPKDFRTRNIASLQPTSEFVGHSQAVCTTSPRLFTGSNTMLGLVPPNSQEGDIIVQFWNSSACAVLRKKPYNGPLLKRYLETPQYELIGRAAIVTGGIDADWDVPRDKDAFGPNAQDAVDLTVTVDDLTKLSLDTVNFEGIE